MRIRKEYFYFFVNMWVFCTGVRAEHLDQLRSAPQANHLPTFPAIVVGYDDLLRHHNSWSAFQDSTLRQENVHPSAVLDILRNLPESSTWRCEEGKLEHLMPVVRDLIRSWSKEKRAKYEYHAGIKGPLELEAGLQADRLDIVAEVAHRYPETTLEVKAVTILMKDYLDKYKFAHASVYARALLGFKKPQELSTEDLLGVYLSLLVSAGSEKPSDLIAVRKELSGRSVPQKYFGQMKEIADKYSVSVPDLILSELSSGDRAKRENALRLLRYAKFSNPDCESLDLRGALVSADPSKIPSVLRGLGVLNKGNDSDEVRFLVKRFELGTREGALEQLFRTVLSPKDRAVLIGMGFSSSDGPERDRAAMEAAYHKTPEDFLPYAHDLQKIIWDPRRNGYPNQHAASVFSRLGPKAIPMFEKALVHADAPVKVASLDGLALLPEIPEAAIEKAALFLNSKNTMLVFAAAKVLAKSKKYEKEALQKVLPFLSPSHAEWLRLQALGVLPYFRELDRSVLEQILDIISSQEGSGAYEVIKEAARVLGKFGKKAEFAVPKLKTTIADGKTLQVGFSFNALADIVGFDEAIKPFESRLEKETISMTSTLVLHQLAANYQYPAVKHLIRSKDANLRKKAIYTICCTGFPEYPPLLKPHTDELVELMLTKGPDEWQTATITNTYLSVATPDAFEKGLKHSDPKIRMIATQGLLSRDQSAKTIDKVISLLKDKDKQVVVHTINHLTSLDSTATDKVVPAMLREIDDRKDQIAIYLVQELAKIGKKHPDVISKFIQLIDDKDIDMRETAIFGLGRMEASAEKALPRLRQITEAKDGTRLRAAAEIAIKQITRPEYENLGK